MQPTSHIPHWLIAAMRRMTSPSSFSDLASLNIGDLVNLGQLVLADASRAGNVVTSVDSTGITTLRTAFSACCPVCSGEGSSNNLLRVTGVRISVTYDSLALTRRGYAPGFAVCPGGAAEPPHCASSDSDLAVKLSHFRAATDMTRGSRWLFSRFSAFYDVTKCWLNAAAYCVIFLVTCASIWMELPASAI